MKKIDSSDYTSVHIIQPYNTRLIIATPSSKEEITHMEEKWGTRNEDGHLAGIYDIKHEEWNAVLVIFNMIHKQSVTYGMIAHESIHILDAVFSKIGHEYNYDNNEPGAYLMEWIYTTILKHFKERNLDSKLTVETEIKPNWKEDI